MAEPFLSEIRIMSFNNVPQGWAECNGQLLAINTNQALFSLLGTTYGGNGQTNFALPDLRGLVPIHKGNGHTLGERGGEAAHTLTAAELPQHTHSGKGIAANATIDSPDVAQLLATAAIDLYRQPTNLAAMDAAMVGNVGGSQAHENRQPFLAVKFCIALQGIFPSQN